jgi:quinolinate synthase
MTVTLSVNDVITAAPSSSCDAELARGPWDFDLAPGYGPGASELDTTPVPVTDRVPADE